MRTLALLGLLIPSIALAQPGPSSDAPPPPAAGAPVYAPPASAPAPAYNQPTYAMPADPLAFHRGVTFEANVGAGFVHLSDASGSSGSSNSVNSDAALAGLDLGIGGWISPHMALTARIAGVDVKINGQGGRGGGTVVNAFFGPSLQYWTDAHLWFGGGAGFSTFRLVGGDCVSNGTDQCGVNGFGLDLRAGYSFGTTAHTFNVSLELNPGFYSKNGSSGTATGVGFLVGYQYL